MFVHFHFRKIGFDYSWMLALCVCAFLVIGATGWTLLAQQAPPAGPTLDFTQNYINNSASKGGLFPGGRVSFKGTTVTIRFKSKDVFSFDVSNVGVDTGSDDSGQYVHMSCTWDCMHRVVKGSFNGYENNVDFYVKGNAFKARDVANAFKHLFSLLKAQHEAEKKQEEQQNQSDPFAKPDPSVVEQQIANQQQAATQQPVAQQAATQQSDDAEKASQSAADWEQQHQAKIDELKQEIADHERQAQQDDADAQQGEAQASQSSGVSGSYGALANAVNSSLETGLEQKMRNDAAEERQKAQDERDQLAELGAEQPPVAVNNSSIINMTRQETANIRSGNTISGALNRQMNNIQSAEQAAQQRREREREQAQQQAALQQTQAQARQTAQQLINGSITPQQAVNQIQQSAQQGANAGGGAASSSTASPSPGKLKSEGVLETSCLEVGVRYGSYRITNRCQQILNVDFTQPDNSDPNNTSIGVADTFTLFPGETRASGYAPGPYKVWACYGAGPVDVKTGRMAEYETSEVVCGGNSSAGALH